MWVWLSGLLMCLLMCWCWVVVVRCIRCFMMVFGISRSVMVVFCVGCWCCI